jgi:hypothetical protein
MVSIPNEGLIQAMLNDIGVQGDEVRNATTKFAERRITESPDLETGDLQQQMACFAHGFREGRGIE